MRRTRFAQSHLGPAERGAVGVTVGCGSKTSSLAENSTICDVLGEGCAIRDVPAIQNRFTAVNPKASLSKVRRMP
jgi:hypothetical protein